jgi:hypothetical protein
LKSRNRVLLPNSRHRLCITWTRNPFVNNFCNELCWFSPTARAASVANPRGPPGVREGRGRPRARFSESEGSPRAQRRGCAST